MAQLGNTIINGDLKINGDLRASSPIPGVSFDSSTGTLNIVSGKQTVSYAEGTVTSDANGFVTLPTLGFAPRTIILYRLEWYQPGEAAVGDYETYAGVMLSYVTTDGSKWVGSLMEGFSGEMGFSGDSANIQGNDNLIQISSGQYKLRTFYHSMPSSGDGLYDVTSVIFNYRAYA